MAPDLVSALVQICPERIILNSGEHLSHTHNFYGCMYK